MVARLTLYSRASAVADSSAPRRSITSAACAGLSAGFLPLYFPAALAIAMPSRLAFQDQETLEVGDDAHHREHEHGAEGRRCRR